MSDSLAILSAKEKEWGEGEEKGERGERVHPPPYTVATKQESKDLPELRVYGVRWYILALFCGMAWGPIESGAQFAFGWPASTVPMLANWGTIMFLLSVVPLSKFVEMDLRKTVLLVSGLMALGTVLRCGRKFINNPTIFLISCHACAILNGISGVTVMAAPPLISSTWFPTSERTTATAVNQAANALGNGIAMLLGPALLHYTPANTTTTTTTPTTTTSTTTNGPALLLFTPANATTAFHLVTANSSNSTALQEEVKGSIDTYMEILAAASVLLFLLFLLYFPSKPDHPPAPSSAIERTEFVAGIKALLTNRDVLLACLAYSIPGGVMGAYMSVMVNQIRPLGYSDQQIGMLGLASVLGQCLLSMAAGLLTDRLRHRIKATLLVLLATSTAAFLWLTLMCLPSSPVAHSLPRLYAAIIIATSAAYSCCPLFFEMTVELAYPVNESTVAGFLTAMNNLVGMFFLLLFFVPSLTSGRCLWMSYSLVASTALAIPVTALIREHYNRSNVDEVALNINS